MSRPLPPRRRRAERGFSIIEAIIAMSILAIGLIGMAALQIVAVRANQFGSRMGHASALARDLAENAQRWDYADARLAVLETVASADDAKIQAKWEMGRAEVVPSSARAQFGELAGDTNATTANALGATYQGLSPDLDLDGTPEFHRYWTSWGLDLTASGTPQGKLVQIVVRWKDASVSVGGVTGYRQVALSTYVPNPQAALQ